MMVTNDNECIDYHETIQICPNMAKYGQTLKVYMGCDMKVTRKYQWFCHRCVSFTEAGEYTFCICLGNEFTRGFFFCQGMSFFGVPGGVWSRNATDEI